MGSAVTPSPGRSVVHFRHSCQNVKSSLAQTHSDGGERSFRNGGLRFVLDQAVRDQFPEYARRNKVAFALPDGAVGAIDTKDLLIINRDQPAADRSRDGRFDWSDPLHEDTGQGAFEKRSRQLGAPAASLVGLIRSLGTTNLHSAAQRPPML